MLKRLWRFVEYLTSPRPEEKPSVDTFLIPERKFHSIRPPENPVRRTLDEVKQQLQDNQKSLQTLTNQFQQIKHIIKPKEDSIFTIPTTNYFLLKKGLETKFMEEQAKIEPGKSILHNPCLLQDDSPGNLHSIKNKILALIEEYPHTEAIKILSWEKYKETAKIPRDYFHLCEMSITITTTLYELANKINGEIEWHRYLTERCLDHLIIKIKRKETLSEPQQKLISRTSGSLNLDIMKSELMRELDPLFTMDPDKIIARTLIHLNKLLSYLTTLLKITLPYESKTEKKESFTTGKVIKTLSTLPVQPLLAATETKREAKIEAKPIAKTEVTVSDLPIAGAVISTTGKNKLST